jgi:hypothetical protein
MSDKEPVVNLEKLGNDKFRLTTTFDRLVRVEEFDKSFLKESYDAGIKEYNDITEQLKKVNKKIKETEHSPEDATKVEEFIEMNNKAHKYGEYKKALDQRDAIIDLMKRHTKQKEDIERVCPELKRAKK